MPPHPHPPPLSYKYTTNTETLRSKIHTWATCARFKTKEQKHRKYLPTLVKFGQRPMWLKSKTYKLQLCSSFCNKCPVITGKQCTRTQLATTQRPDWVGRTKTKYTDWQFYFMERALLTIPIFYKRCTYINLQKVYPYWKKEEDNLSGATVIQLTVTVTQLTVSRFVPGGVTVTQLTVSSFMPKSVGHPANSFRFWAEGCNSHQAYSCLLVLRRGM